MPRGYKARACGGLGLALQCQDPCALVLGEHPRTADFRISEQELFGARE
jgi:hypothetical protein